MIFAQNLHDCLKNARILHNCPKKNLFAMCSLHAPVSYVYATRSSGGAYSAPLPLDSAAGLRDGRVAGWGGKG